MLRVSGVVFRLCNVYFTCINLSMISASRWAASKRDQYLCSWSVSLYLVSIFEVGQYLHICNFVYVLYIIPRGFNDKVLVISNEIIVRFV